jgi:hypothetical protein
MNIESIPMQPLLRATQKILKPASSRTAGAERYANIKDSWEPSAKKDQPRLDLLAAIKKKIGAGYYNSREVIDDVSDSFAKAFNIIQ